MAYEIPVLKVTFPANGDLSAAQYKFVELNSSGQVTVCNAATDRPIGVLQNKPDATGKAAEVVVMGVTKVNSDAALTVGLLIGPSADGQADSKVPGSDTTEYAVGTVIEASGAAGGYATAVINCAAPHRAA